MIEFLFGFIFFIVLFLQLHFFEILTIEDIKNLDIKKLKKRPFCKHENLIYRGIDECMWLRWRNIECNDCGKKFTSLTMVKPGFDNYKKKINQKLNKKDIAYFGREHDDF